VLVLAQASVAAVIAATAWAAGSIVSGGVSRRAPASEPEDAAMTWAFTMALGLAFITQMLLLAGLAGMLR
jgi:hypothetical protein